MNKEIILQTLKKDPSILEYWKSFVNDTRFKYILFIIESQKGKYALSEKESEHPHIQSERNGGSKGWAKCLNSLIHLPFKEDIFEEDKDEADDFSYTDTPWK